MYKQAKIITAFSLLLLPTLASANAGSTVMWFGVLHSLILNAVIGWTESAIIRKFKIPNRTWLIIVANYISMFIGLFYIAPHFSTLYGDHEFWGSQMSYRKGFLEGMFASFVATLIIEFPFFYLAVKDKLQRKQIFIPFLVANTLTNVIMIIIYIWILKSS